HKTQTVTTTGRVTKNPVRKRTLNHERTGLDTRYLLQGTLAQLYPAAADLMTRSGRGPEAAARRPPRTARTGPAPPSSRVRAPDSRWPPASAVPGRRRARPGGRWRRSPRGAAPKSLAPSSRTRRAGAPARRDRGRRART